VKTSNKIFCGHKIFYGSSFLDRQGAKNFDGGWGIFSKKIKIVYTDKEQEEAQKEKLFLQTFFSSLKNCIPSFECHQTSKKCIF
jgi:hypothetical protein